MKEDVRAATVGDKNNDAEDSVTQSMWEIEEALYIAKQFCPVGCLRTNSVEMFETNIDWVSGMNSCISKKKWVTREREEYLAAHLLMSITKTKSGHFKPSSRPGRFRTTRYPLVQQRHSKCCASRSLITRLCLHLSFTAQVRLHPITVFLQAPDHEVDCRQAGSSRW